MQDMTRKKIVADSPLSLLFMKAFSDAYNYIY
jgi:hypothetical protein